RRSHRGRRTLFTEHDEAHRELERIRRGLVPFERPDEQSTICAALKQVGGPGADRELGRLKATTLGDKHALFFHGSSVPGGLSIRDGTVCGRDYVGPAIVVVRNPYFCQQSP